MKDKALLTVKEFCFYLGIGQTKARELLAENADVFAVRIGNRLYAHKENGNNENEKICIRFSDVRKLESRIKKKRL